MEAIKKHGATIGIVAGATAVIATGLYLLFKKTDKDELEDVEIVDETGIVLTKADKQAILSSIKVDRNQGILTIPAIAGICDATLKFASPEFIKITKKDRKERRANKTNLKRYIELWDDYAQRLEEIIESSQREVLNGLGISDNDWETSNTVYMENNNQQLMMLHATLPQKLKMSLGSSKILSKDEFKNVLRAQVKYLNEEADNAEEISNYIRRVEELAPIIQNRVNDKIFEEHGIEEEDVYASMRQYMMDPEVQGIFMELQQATMKLMPMQGGPGGLF
jgi:predicted metal-dependent hydrolase